MKRMNNTISSIDGVFSALKERTKELNCIYEMEKLLECSDLSRDQVFRQLIPIIENAWQYPQVTRVRISVYGKEFQSSNFQESLWKQSIAIKLEKREVGGIDIFYVEEMPVSSEGPFLAEERKLLGNIGERLGHYLFYEELKARYSDIEETESKVSGKRTRKWKIVLDLIARTDLSLLALITKKMMYRLCWAGNREAQDIMHRFVRDVGDEKNFSPWDDNCPLKTKKCEDLVDVKEKIFTIASEVFSDGEIVFSIEKWMLENNASFLIEALENNTTPFSDIADAVSRYCFNIGGNARLPLGTQKQVTVALIRQILTRDLSYSNIAGKFLEISDFHDLFQHTISPAGGSGTLGGKSSGLFLAMRALFRKYKPESERETVKVPRTWYITSDTMFAFIRHNNLGDILEQKYKNIDQVRQEYPHIIQVFKAAHLPAEIVNGLSRALDDFGEVPLIVRSSSLLEDNFKSSFAGKYKSLFLANQGTKKERLEALTDAISEIYASTFAPDPIAYRMERNLIDFKEEMGLMIQEVVGKKAGKYFFPAFAGVAFSNNEFKWSNRIKREDGLLRIVPGLGTRAVDRLSDDYPIIVSPGKPGLRISVTPDEVLRYAPKKVDVIDLEANSFTTITFDELLKEVGSGYPGLKKIVSIHERDLIRKPVGIDLEFEDQTGSLIVTLEGLFSDTTFFSQMKRIMDCLEKALNFPVDLEFASDGEYVYLLQCRHQCHCDENRPVPIPKEIPEANILFTAKKHISNGYIPDITHLVYVDPTEYGKLATREDMLRTGKAIGKLNKILPRRQFILMGPGRWGSRGDIKLGVSVRYSDINNTAALVEIAKKCGNYVPDLSFGTHFFQDLVEANIRYLPLYPDDEGILFNERFITGEGNLLKEILPGFRDLDNVIHVIDIRSCSNGKVLRILMNSELNEAMGILADPSKSSTVVQSENSYQEQKTDDSRNWNWRMYMVKQIASELDPGRFGVKNLYVIGSTKNETAAMGSDIDLLVHFGGAEEKKQALLLWLDGWSKSLDVMNYLRTGYRAGGLLDIHIVTDDDIKKKTSFASKIGAITDAAILLPTGKREKKSD